MAEDISAKIDFLMKVTNIQNAMLAHALNFDASYISRIRTGKRGLPPKQPFIEPACELFARNVREQYQKDALANTLELSGPWPADQGTATRLLIAWLQGQSGNSGPLGASAPESKVQRAVDKAPGTPAQVQLFFGDAGRREGACAFLGYLAKSGYSGTLLLQSDESINWMYDERFASKWASLIVALSQAGCTFRIVHTVTRDSGEMWEGVHKWLSLYMTGAFEPYYYPRPRDGVRNRSLFVAPGSCALTANSVRGMQGDALSVLTYDPEAVTALQHEFEAYLNLCIPLMTRVLPDSTPNLGARASDLLGTPTALFAANIGNALVCAKDGYGALVVSAGQPRVAFFIDEPRLVRALCEYLGSLSEAQSDSVSAQHLLERLAQESADNA